MATARDAFRQLLQGQLPTIYDLVNTEILGQARSALAGHGFDDILIIVDQLDRIPQKLLNERGLTNHENLFLDHAGTLRGLRCNVLYTVPIELAYSHCQNRLQDVYGGPILTLPAIPVRDRAGNDSPSGLCMLREIVRRRAARAGVALSTTFASPELLTEVLRRSGGHIRGLFVLLRSILERAGELPVTQGLVERSLRWAAADAARPLRPGDWELLENVRASHQRANPLLELVQSGGRPRAPKLPADRRLFERGRGAWRPCPPHLGHR